MQTLADWNWALDGWIVAAGMLSAAGSALLGNFLVLRKLSMLGDAISHAVLPGLAAAFFVSGSRDSLPMFLGAILVGVLTAVATEWVRGIGRVDEGAAMGVVFTSLFALGLVLIVQAADHVDLDPGCVLYGAIELTPLDVVSVAGFPVPRAVVMLSIVAGINLAFVLGFYKELQATAFDPALATSQGFSATGMHYLLMILVAVTAVASFESVGNILVVAMFVVPPAAAYMLTDRLPWMIALSVLLAVVSAVAGHGSALVVPAWFGLRSTNTAGMMAVAAGILFLLAASLGPRHGVLPRVARRRLLSWKILADDLVGLLYRLEERGQAGAARPEELRAILLADRVSLRMVLAWLRCRAEVVTSEGRLALAERGRIRARNLVRAHRLWEQYLVAQAGMATERIHHIAERFEHFTDARLRGRLDAETDRPRTDPHGSRIPPERKS